MNQNVTHSKSTKTLSLSSVILATTARRKKGSIRRCIHPAQKLVGILDKQFTTCQYICSPCACVCVCVHAWVCMCVCMHECVCVSIYVCLSVYLCVCAHTCVCQCVCACLSVCILPVAEITDNILEPTRSSS